MRSIVADWFTDPPPWPVIVALGCVGALLLIALTAVVLNIPAKENNVTLLTKLAPYRKAIVAAAFGLATAWAAQRGIDLNVWVQRAIAMLAGGGVVYAVPNKPAA